MKIGRRVVPLFFATFPSLVTLSILFVTRRLSFFRLSPSLLKRGRKNVPPIAFPNSSYLMQVCLAVPVALPSNRRTMGPEVLIQLKPNIIITIIRHGVRCAERVDQKSHQTKLLFCVVVMIISRFTLQAPKKGSFGVACEKRDNFSSTFLFRTLSCSLSFHTLHALTLKRSPFAR